MPSDVAAQTNFPPKLDGTLETNQLLCAWVTDELLAGRLDPRVADSAMTSAKAEAADIHKKFTQNEMSDLRELVERAEAANAEWKRREMQTRRDAGDGTEKAFGRVKVG